MRLQSKSSVTIFFFLFLSLLLVSSAASQEYKGLKGVETANTIFDFRDGVPESALVHLQLVRETYKSQAIQNLPKKPNFVVVFMGPSVKLLSTDRKGFSAEEQKMLKQMDEVIAGMVKDGIVLEVCMVAVTYFAVDPNTISKEIGREENGWISSLGYQSQGYALVPVF